MNATPKNRRKKFYITTAIAYVNAPPHIGFALESVQADAIARCKRAEGFDVRFLTGVDEHGDKIARAAEAVHKTPRAFVGTMSRHFKHLKKLLNLSWDDFIRTSSARHRRGALALWSALAKGGALYKKRYRGLYCVGCEKFITEKELVGGLCPHHQRAPETLEEENFFFRLSRYGSALEKLIASGKYRVTPESRRNEILSFIRAGLEDVSFSRARRNLAWGIPIPKSDQTMYVWCDALSNYATAVGLGGEGAREKAFFKTWWPADVHLIGKDITRFHAVFWPAMLLAARLPLPKNLFVHGFITVDGQKMSKTLGNVVDPVELVKKYGVDPVRYYLLRELPSDEDGDFSVAKFEARYRDDLSRGLGNFASRVSALASPLRFSADMRPSREVVAEAKRAEKLVRAGIDSFKLHDALAAVFELVRFGDVYVNAHRVWVAREPRRIYDLVFLLREVSRLLAPFLPGTSARILRAFRETASGLRVRKITPLFPRLEGK